MIIKAIKAFYEAHRITRRCLRNAYQMDPYERELWYGEFQVATEDRKRQMIRDLYLGP